MKMILLALFSFVSLLAVGNSLWASSRNSQWRANYFPNFALVTHDGKTVHFYDGVIKNKVVAISFIFTHCNGPCPAETANLRQVQKLLGDRVGRDVFMYSISIDPENDTPQVMKNYAKKFNVGPGWLFLTGKKDEITELRRKLGVYSSGSQTEKLEDHNVTFIIGNEATGKWIKRSPFDHPKVLAQLLGGSLQTLPVTPPGQVSYSHAKLLPQLSHGEDLFRSRCVSCHSLGNEDAIGPALAGVTQKRSRVWLSQWLKSPDQLIAKKDPVAMGLFTKYKKLQMPNLKLNDSDVEALIAFMGNKTTRAER